MRQSCSVIFATLRRCLKKENPIKAVSFANEVLAVLGKEVEKNKGVVDRFMGDGFLAHFGVDETDVNHADSACRTALDLRIQLRKIKSERYLNQDNVLNIGIGIHSGEVAVGEITSGKTTLRTILGDTVNTASRIESLAKFFSLDTLITESTKNMLSEDLKLQKMPLKKLKGKEQSVQTYWLLPMN